MKVSISPVGHGNNDNIHFIVKFGSKKNPFIKFKLVGFFKTMKAYITNCSIPKEQLEYFNLAKISGEINNALKDFDFEIDFINFHRDFHDNRNISTSDVMRLIGVEGERPIYNLVRIPGINKQHFYLISTKKFPIGTTLTNIITNEKELVEKYTNSNMVITSYTCEIGDGENWTDLEIGHYKEQLVATTDPLFWSDDVKKIDLRSIQKLNFNPDEIIGDILKRDVLFIEKTMWSRNTSRNVPTQSDIDDMVFIIGERNKILIKNE